MSDLTMLSGFTPSDFGLTEYESYRKHPVTGDEVQLEVVEFLAYSEKRFACAAVPVGCHERGQEILMYDGSLLKVEQLRVGDVVMGWQSTPQKITHLHSGFDVLYRINPVKGSPFVVNGNHVLTLMKTCTGTRWKCDDAKVEDIEVSDFINRKSNYKDNRKLFRHGCDFAVNLPVSSVIDPYSMGMLLGDGSIQHGTAVTAVDSEIIESIYDLATRNGLKVRTKGIQFFLVTSKGKGIPNKINNELKRMGLFGTSCGDKFVPVEYKSGSRTVRLGVLAGLLDTDGHYTNGCYDYISKSPQLASDVAYIARSLGFAAYIKPCQKYDQNGQGGTYHRVSISGDLVSVPCRLPRKKPLPRRQKKDVLRTGFTVERIGLGKYFGFTLDGDGRYLMGDFTVTHNCGKSLIALTLAKMTGLRTAIVVPFKGLQEQYSTQFARHTVDIRGKANYDCGDYQHLTCKGGASMGCRYTFPNYGCTYDVKKAQARDAQALVTNYDYWLTLNDNVAGGLQRNKAEAEEFGANPIELLILDEGDEAADKVADYLSVSLNENDIKRWTNPKSMGDGIKDWQALIKEFGITEELKLEIRTLGMELVQLGKKATKQHLEDLHYKERLLTKFSRVEGAKDEWVCEAKIGTRYGRQWNFDVAAPGRYMEQYLFCGIPKVVIMSGTLTPKDMALMWIKRENYEYRQWSRIFPANRQPIYICPPRKKDEKGQLKAVMVQRNMTEENKRLWVEHIDQIIDGRLDRNGLIGTSSYEYQQYFMEHSRHADIMVGNTNDPDSDSAAEIAEKFFVMKAPRLLVSPSFARGWDFAFERAEYAILTKCPWLPTQSKVMQARVERDELYGHHVTMKKVEQFCGRPMRDFMDRGEVFLCDGHFTYFIRNNAKLAQRWFVDGVRTVIDIPKAPPKLEPRPAQTKPKIVQK